MNAKDVKAYQKHISDTYDERSGNHDNSDWHWQTARRLLEELAPSPGDRVLDIGTGTGFLAFHASSRVGPEGGVTGVDISEGMLKVANAKLAESGLNNLQFKLSDIESLSFPAESFDRIYCASAFFCILHPAQALKHWYQWLKPGGGIGFHACPETSYIWVSLARDVLANYGVSYTLNSATGSKEKCYELLADAGFRDIDIRVHEFGEYISLEKAKREWIQMDTFVPGQYPNPIAHVSKETLQQAQRDYEHALEKLNTEKGVWNDLSVYYVYAKK